MKRTLRHPIRGDRLHPKPGDALVASAPPGGGTRSGPRMRPRKSVNVASIVGSPEEEEARPNLRLRIVGIVVLLLFGVLVLRLWTLQVVEGKSYAAAVTRNQVRVVSVAAPRGEIVDRNGTVLVSNMPQQEILLSRAEATQNPAIVGMVAALVGQTPQAGAGVHQQQPVQPVRAGARRGRCVAGHGPVPPDAPGGVPGRERADRGAAHLSPGGDDGDADPRLRRRHLARATWPRTRTTATPRAARSASRGSRPSTSRT